MSIKQHYLKASFLVCTLILLAAAGSKEIVINTLGVHMVKLAIPLQSPLDDLNEASLAPYTILNKSKIDGATLESLGTEEYLQWFLEDTDAEPSSPTRYCSLFITYYTGTPDMVPHVPDECYVGGGNEFKSKQTLALNFPDRDKIDFQCIRFTRTSENGMQGSSEFTVQYFFHANGKFCGSRTETRKLLGQNWFSKYSYFCKVEWKFFGRDSFGDVYPNQEQTLAASEKLMAILLGELEANHWPDWQAANAKQE